MWSANEPVLESVGGGGGAFCSARSHSLEDCFVCYLVVNLGREILEFLGAILLLLWS